MNSFLEDKMKYVREPYRLRVHLGYLLILTLTILAEPTRPFFEIGTGMIFCGILIRIWASGILMKDEELATNGPYALCRNPLYVGNILIGFGFAFLNSFWWSYAVVLFYLLIFYPPTIRKEESKMKEFFGDEFEEYKRNVPLLIPRIQPYDSLEGWSFQQYFQENKDYLNEGAVLIFWCYCAYFFLR